MATNNKKISPTVHVVPSTATQIQGMSFSPTGPLVSLINLTMTAGDEHFDSLESREKAISHAGDFTAKRSNKTDGVVLVKKKGDKSESVVRIDNIYQVKSKNKGLRKVFTFIMTKAGEQCVDANGRLKRAFVSFDLKELVGLGTYKTEKVARQQILECGDILQGIKARGTVTRYEDKEGTHEETIELLAVLFPTIAVSNGQCVVHLNNAINWGAIIPFFTCLPDYHYGLGAKASDLLRQAVFIARMHTGDIASRGWFTIKMRTIQSRLMLPPETTKDHKRLIRKPIIDAVQEINEADIKDDTGRKLHLEIVAKDNCSIQDFLENGFIKVTALGQFKDRMLELDRQKQQQIETMTNRKQRAIERNMAKAKKQTADTAEGKE